MRRPFSGATTVAVVGMLSHGVIRTSPCRTAFLFVISVSFFLDRLQRSVRTLDRWNRDRHRFAAIRPKHAMRAGSNAWIGLSNTRRRRRISRHRWNSRFIAHRGLTSLRETEHRTRWPILSRLYRLAQSRTWYRPPYKEPTPGRAPEHTRLIVPSDKSKPRPDLICRNDSPALARSSPSTAIRWASGPVPLVERTGP